MSLARRCAAPGISVRIARVDQAFDFPSRGPFDGKYMQALYEFGVAAGEGDRLRRRAARASCTHRASTGSGLRTRLPARHAVRVPTNAAAPRGGAGTSCPGRCHLRRRCWPGDLLAHHRADRDAALPSIAGGWQRGAGAGNPAPERGAACPPDVKGDPPTVGGGSSQPLSDKLAQSKGVICPPSASIRDTRRAARRRRLKVSAAGYAGRRSSVQPK